MLSLRNDVGLLAEEYYPGQKSFAGNFPQAFSHVGLVNSIINLMRQWLAPAIRLARAGSQPERRP